MTDASISAACQSLCGSTTSRFSYENSCVLARRVFLPSVSQHFKPFLWNCYYFTCCYILLGGVVVRASDLWSRDREFDSRPVHCRVAYVNSAFHPSGVGKPSTIWLGLRRGVFTCVGWQVTLCDPMWQVTPCSSVMGLVSWRAIRSFNLFLLFYDVTPTTVM